MAIPFTKRILLGISAIKQSIVDYISAHNAAKAAHPNGFNHDITIATTSEPTIKLQQTSHAIGSGSTTMGTIGFTDKNNKWIWFVDTECTTGYNALDIHINNVGTPGDYYNTPTVCTFKRNNDANNTCSMDLAGNIIIRRASEPALVLEATGQTMGTSNVNGGAILFRDKNTICLSAIDVDTATNKNILNFHVASTNSTTTSTDTPSVMSLVHDNTGTKYLDLMDNSIRRARVSTPSASDNKLSIVNKEYVDTKLTSINTSLANKANKTHTHTAAELGIGAFPTWTNVTNVSKNTTYTTQHDGYLMLGMGGGNGVYWIDTTINGTKYTWYGNSSDAYKYGWQNMQLCLPMAKGVTYSFNGSQGFYYARFVAAI